MQDSKTVANRSIDLKDVRPVAVQGGTAILAQTYRTLSTGIEIESGEQPVCVAGVYSPRDLEHSLREAGFNVECRGENATRLVSIAEQAAGHAEVLA